MPDQSLSVYYIGAGADEDYSDAQDELNKVGARLTPLPRLETEDEVVAQASDADGLIVVHSPITRKVLSQLPQCKVVLRTGVGYDVIDVPAATELGVAIVNVPDMWTQEVANQALALLLACNRRVVSLDRWIRSGQWDERIAPPVGSLYGETLGIIGLGRIGTALARRAAALDMHVMAYDPYISAGAFEEAGVRAATLDELLSESDYVSVNCPLTDETRGIVDAEALRKMKPTSYLINTARGPVIDEMALIQALEEGSIAGAGLDVLEHEPPRPDNLLLAMENVVLSPHAGHYSDLSISKRPRRYGAEVACVLSGRMPLHLVNPEVRERLPLRDD